MRSFFFGLVYVVKFTNGPRSEKTCLQGFTNKKGADQRPFSVFVIRVSEGIDLFLP